MATEIEYERTFLAAGLPAEIAGETGALMHDIMIPDTARHPHLRLRQRGETYVITKKVPARDDDLTEMIEETIPLEKAEFDALANSSTKNVVKYRYNVIIDGYPAEVDVFDEKLKGLVLIDFEFASNREKAAFKTPDVCLADVSQEEAFAGGLLAGKSYEDIEPILKKYEYKRIAI